MTNSKRLVKNTFLAIYFLTGIYLGLAGIMVMRILHPDNFTEFILFHGIFFVPLLTSSIGVLVSIKRRDATVYLWLCSIYWLIISLGEIIEGGKIRPNAVFIISMLLVSLSCIIFLTIQNKIIKKL